jgi:small subunit ribosomal protein S10
MEELLSAQEKKRVKTRLILESFKFSFLSDTCSNLMNVLQGHQDTKPSGPFVFPKTKVYYCLLSSPHVYKNAREHIGMQKYRCLVDINTTLDEPGIIENLLKVEIPPGVSVRIKYLNR